MVLKPELLFLKKDLKKLEGFLSDFAESLDGVLKKAVISTLNAGGKRIRPSLFFICARNGKYSIDYLLPAAAAIEIIHTASLIHDDIIDKSTLRRGKTTIHNIYDRDTAKFVGDYLFTQTFYLLNGYKIPEILNETAEAARLLVKGEFNQLKTKRNIRQRENIYLEKITEKTSSLFKLSCLLGGLLSKSEKDDIKNMQKFGEYIGISFQINDDLLDVSNSGNGKNIGKPIGNDLRQGDVTLPYIYGSSNVNFKKQFEAFISKESLSSLDVEKILNLLYGTDAIEKTRKKFEFYISRARIAANMVKGEERRKALLAVCDLIQADSGSLNNGDKG
jgi:heptaprenyl diphosphate synthase